MAVATYRVLREIKNSDGTSPGSSTCPIAFRDVDETIAWTMGTHIADDYWLFKIPSGLSSGIKWAVQTASGVFTESAYLNGGAFSGDDDLGEFVGNAKIST